MPKNSTQSWDGVFHSLRDRHLQRIAIPNYSKLVQNCLPKTIEI
ncbi:hypothetical protein [Nostoc sp. FACHB-892]|nr:hypothetical protein [Nostoc sp. FACHB-892]